MKNLGYATACALACVDHGKHFEHGCVARIHGCEGGCAHPGLVAVVTPYEWGERADVTFYCDDESHDYQPTPEEIETTEAFRKRRANFEAMGERITEFAKGIFPKFPATGQAKLRQWAYEAFEVEYGCEPNDAWTGFKQPKGKALDQFVLMRAIPVCIPDIPERALKSDYELWPYDLDDLFGFVSFIDDVLVPARFALSEDKRDLVDHLHGIFADDGEDNSASLPLDGRSSERSLSHPSELGSALKFLLGFARRSSSMAASSFAMMSALSSGSTPITGTALDLLEASKCTRS